jgi:hypothetical protein
VAEITVQATLALLNAKESMILELLAENHTLRTENAVFRQALQQQAPAAPTDDDPVDLAAVVAAAEERSRRDREDVARRKREMQAGVNGAAVPG